MGTALREPDSSLPRNRFMSSEKCCRGMPLSSAALVMTPPLREFDTQIGFRKLFERSLLRLHVWQGRQDSVAEVETLGFTLWKQSSDISRLNGVIGREHDHVRRHCEVPAHFPGQEYDTRTPPPLHQNDTAPGSLPEPAG